MISQKRGPGNVCINKMDKRISKFLKNGHVEIFDTIAIETCEYCNRRCPFCPNSLYSVGKNLMPEKLFKNLILQLKKINYSGTIIYNQYNEPLWDKRLERFMNFTRSKLPNAFQIISSNGDYLNYDRWISLRKSGLNYAIVSQYDGKINKNIKELLEKLPKSERKALVVRKRGSFNLDSTRCGLVNLNKRVKQPLKENCFRPFSQIVVRHSGLAVLCCEDYLSKVVIGDTAKEEIMDIWNSEKFNKIRRNLINERRKGICSKCNTGYKYSVESCKWISTRSDI